MENDQTLNNYTKNKDVSDQAKGKYVHLLVVPFTGLGLYFGYRGARWLKNRVKIFEQFVIPSLLNQTCKDFTVWVAWRPEERHNGIVKNFVERLGSIKELKFIHTFSGCPIYDDKYPDEIARERLTTAIHGAMSELVNATEGEFGYEYVLMTIQPSDDCYHKDVIKGIQSVFKEAWQLQAIGFKKGYLMNYQTKELAEWNPSTNPPFYTIKFLRADFIDTLKHIQHTALKHDVGKYKKGTPLPSHEYVGDCLRYGLIADIRGFLVGVHGDNISTVWDHPYKGEIQDAKVLADFGLEKVEPLKRVFSPGRILFDCLPFKVKRKLRYLAGEKQWILRPVFNLIYNLLRT